MPEERPSEVLGALPRTRPHRRSDKRGARPATSDAPAAQPTPDAPAPEQTKPAKSTAATTRAKPIAAARKRPAKPKLRQPAQPTGTPAAKARTRRPAATPKRPTSAVTAGAGKPRPASGAAKPSGGDILGTAVQAAAELAEIGLAVSARAIRGAIQRLPRP